MRAFVIAMESEAEAVRPAIKAEDRLYVSGIGKVNAALTTQKAIDEGADEIVNAGVCGGFDSTMEIGDVFEVGRAVEYDFDLAELNDTRVGQLDERDSPYFILGEGKTLGSGDHFRNDDNDLPLLRELGVDLRDMEGAAIAHVCEKNSTRCRMIKSVTNVQGKGSMTGQYADNLKYALGTLTKYLKGALCALFALALIGVAEAAEALTDGEIWNEGVTAYEHGDVTNALKVLRPLMLSKSHGARAAEVVAKLEFDRGNREEAARAAQIALRANPKDARANRNFTRAIDNLAEIRENDHINAVLKAAEGKDPAELLKAAVDEARALFTESGTYRTNAPARAVSLADRYSQRAEKLADAWIPVRQVIAQSVTNEQQAAAFMSEIESARKLTRKAAKELADLDGEAYASLSHVEHDFTRYLKLTILPPQALDEDLFAQSNAWQDVEAFNSRPWQREALEYTRAFRAKFPMWARAYEQQAQADTNQVPFTAEAQAEVSALATELEKIQLECCEKNLPAEQEKAIQIINEMRELLPKNKGEGQGQGGGGAAKPPEAKPQDNPEEPQRNESESQEEEQEKEQSAAEKSESEETPPEDQELEDILRKAQERNDEHEAEKRARMRKAPLPPNERDW